jgi:hypothetical protein
MSEMVTSESTSAEFQAMESLPLLKRTYPRWAKQHGKVYINKNNVGMHK